MSALRIALIAVAVGLVGFLGWMTDWGRGFEPSEVSVASVASKVEGASVLPDFKLSADSSAYAQIAERPLLNPTRRPAPTQPIAQVAPEEPKPRIRRGLYQLVGISDFGTVKLAQLRETATNRVRSVKPGDSLQEMTVKSVSENQVVLTFQGETDVVELPKFTASGRVPPPPVIAPPPQQIPPPQQVAAAQPQQVPGLQPGQMPLTPPPINPGMPGGIQPGVPQTPVQAAGVGPDGAPTIPNPSTTAVAPPPQRPSMSMRERLGIGRTQQQQQQPPPAPQ
jgi:hypothetical protein